MRKNIKRTKLLYAKNIQWGKITSYLKNIFKASYEKNFSPLFHAVLLIGNIIYNLKLV